MRIYLMDEAPRIMTTTFTDRIKTDAAVFYIDLTDSEADLYRGCGNAIVYVEGDQIVKFIYIEKIDEGGALDAANEALAHGNAYLGMCSNYTFCEPQKLDGSNPALFARIERLVEENWDIHAMWT